MRKIKSGNIVVLFFGSLFFAILLGLGGERKKQIALPERVSTLGVDLF